MVQWLQCQILRQMSLISNEIRQKDRFFAETECLLAVLGNGINWIRWAQLIRLIYFPGFSCRSCYLNLYILLPHLQLINDYQLQALLPVLLIQLVFCHLNQRHSSMADLVWLIFQLSWAKGASNQFWADL